MVLMGGKLNASLIVGLLMVAACWIICSRTAHADGVAAPDDFTATVVSQTEVDLSWEDLSGGDASYQVERRSSGGEWTEVADLPPNSESFVDDEVALGTYEYRIRAYIDDGFTEFTNFEDSDITDWTVATGPSDWSVVDTSGSNRLTVDNPNSTERIITWGNTAWTDYTLTADVLRNVQAASTQMLFRYTSTSSHYLLLMDYADDLVSLRKKSGSNYPHIADTSFIFASGVVYHVKIHVSGNQIQVYINDNLLIDETDSTNAAGSVGFRITGGYETFYDNVEVSNEEKSEYVNSGPVAVTDIPDAPEDVTATAGSAWYAALEWEDESNNETGFLVERASEGTSNWNVKTTRPDYYGDNYVATDSEAEPTKSITWRPDLPESGNYNVYYWLPEGSPSYASDAPFTVYYNGGEHTYPVDESQAAGGAWVLLGNHPFAAGTSGYVKLTNDADASYVVADAVKFVKGAVTVIVDNDDADFSNLEWISVGRLPANTTQFLSAGLMPNMTYNYRVSAFNASGSSAASGSNTINTPAAVNVVPGVIAAAKTTAEPRKSTSTMARLNNDDLLMVYTAYFGGTSDLDYSKLAMVTSDDDGVTWSSESILFEDPNHQLSSPSLLRLSNGNLGLTYFHNLGDGDIYRVYRYSTDDGATWSSEITMTDGTYDYMSGAHDRLIQLSSGRLIFPVNVVGPGIERTDTMIFASDDNGLTWQKKTAQPITVTDDFFAEASIVEVSPGNLLMIGNTLTGWFYGSRSTDNGNTWSTPTKMDLPNPKAIAQVFKLHDSDALVFISNPSTRSALTSQISLDGGHTWKDLKLIAYAGTNRQFYSPAFLVEDDNVILAYCDIPGTSWTFGANIRVSVHPYSFFGDID